ncbi:hypothetical protein TNCV_917951 [Trichonephila clavipes]|nr:hypothetical protein TNCV_917951 [Trichonephila clavipes]
MLLLETSVPAVHSRNDILENEAPVLAVEPIFNSSLYLVIIGKLSFLSELSGVDRKWVIQIARGKAIRTSISMQDDNPIEQHSISAVLDILLSSCNRTQHVAT